MNLFGECPLFASSQPVTQVTGGGLVQLTERQRAMGSSRAFLWGQFCTFLGVQRVYVCPLSTPRAAATVVGRSEPCTVLPGCAENETPLGVSWGCGKAQCSGKV